MFGNQPSHPPSAPPAQGAYVRYLQMIRSLEKPVVLVGLMGAGKTQLGQQLSEKLDWPFKDSDHEIERVGGLAIHEIFDRFGEEKFRELERRVIGDVLSGEPPKGMVVATGGGAFAEAATRDLIHSRAISVWLRASLPTLVQRTQQSKHRPLLQIDNPAKLLGELMEKRYPLYAHATLTIDTDHFTRWQTLDVVLDRLHGYAVQQRSGK